MELLFIYFDGDYPCGVFTTDGGVWNSPGSVAGPPLFIIAPLLAIRPANGRLRYRPENDDVATS